MLIDTCSPPGTEYVPPHQAAPARRRGAESSSCVRNARVLPAKTSPKTGLSAGREPAAAAATGASIASPTTHTAHVDFLIFSSLTNRGAPQHEARPFALRYPTLKVNGRTVAAPS